MALNLFAILARIFGGSQSSAGPVVLQAAPVQPAPEGAASVAIDPPATQPQADAPQAAGAPVAASAPTWLDLCRPLVRFFESCRLTAYWDNSGNVWTCGWGSTGSDVKQGTVWTQATADARNDAQMNEAATIVDRAVKVSLSPQQKAALTSIVYNVGPGRAASGNDQGRDGIVTLANGQPSTLLKRLNAGDYQGAADQFPAWNKSGGVVLGGLVKRRAAERDLFLTGVWNR